MNAFRCFGWLVLVIAVAVVGCQGNPAATTAKEKIYDIKGKVLVIDTEEQPIKLDHDEIPGFMKAMEMRFHVESPKVIEGLKPGDQVKGKLKVQDKKYILTVLEKQ